MSPGAGRSPASSSKTITRRFPCAFADIIATSAHATSSRGLAAWSGPIATPTDTVIGPTGSNDVVSTVRATRSASRSDVSSVPEGRMIANSSPPIRQTASAPRTELRRMSPISVSTWSPTPWPYTSFTFLKSSRSRITRPTWSCSADARNTAWRSRSWKARWFQSPVSESVCAWCSRLARMWALSIASAAASA